MIQTLKNPHTVVATTRSFLFSQSCSPVTEQINKREEVEENVTQVYAPKVFVVRVWFL